MNLVGYSPWAHKELDTTECACTALHILKTSCHFLLGMKGQNNLVLCTSFKTVTVQKRILRSLSNQVAPLVRNNSSDKKKKDYSEESLSGKENNLNSHDKKKKTIAVSTDCFILFA